MKNAIKMTAVYLMFLAAGLGLGYLFKTIPQSFQFATQKINRSDYFVDSQEKVRLYSTSWCKFCKQTREYFKEKKIAYTDIDIETTAIGKSQYEKLGAGGVPIILMGNRKIQGYSPELFEAARQEIESKK